jgi:signal transduction histidine kinase
MPGGLKVRIVVPLVAVYLATIAACYVLADVLVREESRRRREDLDRRQQQAEERALSAVRELARLFPAGLRDPGAARNAAGVLGYPLLQINEAGSVIATLPDPDGEAARRDWADVWRVVGPQREGAAELTVGGRGYRAVWTAIDPTFFSPRPGRMVVLLPAAGDRPDDGPPHPLWEPFAAVALGGATVVTAAAFGVSWFWARRVARLAGRVDQFIPAEPGSEPPGPARGDEVKRLAAAFERLRTRLEHYQAELVARERLATAGRIAAMMAHEIRNPLTALKLSAQMLAEAEADPDAADTLAVMLREIGRLQILCDQLLTLSGKRNTVRERVDLNAVADEVCRLLAGQAEAGRVTLEFAAGAEVPPLFADGNELRQLLMNLVLNAVAASPPGRCVQVRTERIAGADGAPAEWILRVIDHGPGIDAEWTKPNRSALLSNKPGGSGLGLAICEKIVANHAGRLHLINRGDGTTAEVRLPGPADAE